MSECRELLAELFALVMGESPSLLTAETLEEVPLKMRIEDALGKGRNPNAVQERTCGGCGIKCKDPYPEYAGCKCKNWTPKGGEG